MNRCPAKLITYDIVDIYNSHHLCDGKLTLTEQSNLPNPYLEAFQLVSFHKNQLGMSEVKKHGT